MSREEYQRAVADMMRKPAFCAELARPESRELDNYLLSEMERARLSKMARHRGMPLNCTLYRASRLVGIARRLPRTLQVLGSDLRVAYDAYLAACPDANPDFDTEAQAFATFLPSHLSKAANTAIIDTSLVCTVLQHELDILDN
jgi:hypothetical protein